MEVFNTETVLKSENITTSGIFRLIQDVSADHCEKLGLGGDVLNEKGIIWVVIRQYIKLDRALKAGEKIKISTWPGMTRHMMFPRHYIFRDENDDTVLRGTALWTLVDMNSRKMVIPERYGLSLEGLSTGEEIKMPAAAEKIESSRSAEFTVPEEYLDSNRHMNNARYYDMSEHCMGREGARIKEALTDYISEARLGETILLRWGEDKGRIYITGENQGTVFKMSLEYF